jgi:hypothetical protein
MKSLSGLTQKIDASKIKRLAGAVSHLVLPAVRRYGLPGVAAYFLGWFLFGICITVARAVL